MNYDIGENKKKYSMTKVLSGMIGELFSVNKLFLPFIILYTIAITFINYYPVFFQKEIINTLLVKDVSLFYKYVAIYLTSMSIAAMVSNLTLGYNEPRFSLARINYMTKMLYKQLRINYKYMEDNTFLSRLRLANRATWGNNLGIELTFKMIMQLPPIMVSIVLLSFLIASKNIFILLGIFLNVATIFFVRKLAKDYAYSMRKEEGEADRRMSYYDGVSINFNYGKDLRIYSLTNRIIKGLKEETDKYISIKSLVFNREFQYGFITLFTSILSDVLSYGLLLNMAMNGLNIAEFSQLLTAAVSLSLILKDFFEKVSVLYAEGQYVNEALEYMEEDLGDKEQDRKSEIDGDLEIEFKNVAFTYPGAEDSVFDDINFKIKKGEKLAIVGINGAGKTTLVKLLTGLFRPNSGQILINGIDSSTIKSKSLYKLFSAVFQDVIVQPFSIKANVASSKDNVDEKMVWNALEMVGLKKKVETFDNKLEQKLNKSVYDDATDLSGGEAQKLAIARAIYKDANMVIMDEPTSALDALAEQEIYSNFNDLVKDKTSLYISHRLASTKFCDRIILLDGKTVGEEGSHEELMSKKGKYYDMFMIQGKYYNQDNNTGVANND